MALKRIIILLLVALCFLHNKIPLPANAQAYGTEKINSYNSRITINSDGKLNVTETITVTANGDKIKRGIYRDFPTVYGNFWSLKTKIPFKIVSVTKNGNVEPYHTQNMDNGIRIYIGDSNIYLTPGTYTYKLTYEVDRQLGYFSDHDELYYNITGTGWDFTIDKVTAEVVVPKGVKARDVKTDGYTGFSGDQFKDFSSAINEKNGETEVYFETTSPLMSRQNLTVVIGWPKGYVKEPTKQEKFLDTLKDNLGIFGGIIGTIIVFAYYLLSWAKFGRDPKGKVIIPRFEPPDEKMSTYKDNKYLTPAATRYINRMGFDDKCITATIIDGAIKGTFKINQKNSDYSIERLTAKGPVSEEISILNDVFFSKFTDVFHFDNKQHAIVSSAQAKIKKYLKNKTEDAYFIHNYKFIIPALIFSAISVLFLIGSAGSKMPVAGFIIFWLSIWTTGVSALLATIFASFKSGKILSAVATLIFSIPFIFGEIFGLGVLAWSISIFATIVVAVNIILHIVFFFAMKVRTPLGREIQDQIEGLKLYLTTAEQRRYEMLHKSVPETISMYEKYLPYAVALDIEPQWSKLMDDVLKSITKTGEQIGYNPIWYSGSTPFRSANSLTNNLRRSFTSTLRSASGAPGSRSGFSGGGGGGSSGGGGGGGGGGGW